ncbi:MAG: hypothetical protein P1V51_04940 [Deltaproteobacteria bacterium]|nr:hypothetical protein [Deltaproteobacteria bacterium]
MSSSPEPLDCERECGTECILVDGQPSCPPLCETNADCEPDARCSLLILEEGKAARRCLDSCLRPCDQDEGCPSGEFCHAVEAPPGLMFPSFCRPDCLQGGCPDGETCIPVEDGAHGGCGRPDADPFGERAEQFAEFLRQRN